MKNNMLFLLILFFNITVYGQELSIPSGTTFSASEGTSIILADGTNLNLNSQHLNLNGTVKFMGNEEQTMTGTVSAEINYLYINNNGLILEDNLTVNSELNMQNGILNLQNNSLIIGENANITGNFSENCMIVKDVSGIFQKDISDNGLYLFPIGDISGTSDYNPVNIELLNGSFTDANINVSVENAKYSENNSSTNYLNRYWDINSSGITNPEYNMTLTYVDNDIVGDENDIYSAYFTDEWHLLNLVSNNTITANVNELGIFTGGEQSAFSGTETVLNENISLIGINDGIIINANSNINISQINVFNVLGQEIYQQKGLNSNKIEFNKSVNTGIFFVRMNTDKGTLSIKILIY